MKSFRSTSIAPLILYIGLFIPGKELRYQLSRELGGPRAVLSYFGIEKNLAPTGIRTRDSVSHSLVAIRITLLRLVLILSNFTLPLEANTMSL